MILFIQEIVFEIIVWKTAAILFWTSFVNHPKHNPAYILKDIL